MRFYAALDHTDVGALPPPRPRHIASVPLLLGQEESSHGIGELFL